MTWQKITVESEVEGYYLRWGVPDEKRILPPGVYWIIARHSDYIEVAVSNGAGPSVKHRYVVHEDQLDLQVEISAPSFVWL